MPPKIKNDNSEIFFLVVVLLIVGIGIATFIAGTYIVDTSHVRGLPTWINLSANSTHLTLSYDSASIAGFKEVIVRGTWVDPATEDLRTVYQATNPSPQGDISFLNFIEVGGHSVTVDAEVVSEVNSVTQSTHYLWRVSTNPLSFTGKPEIEFLR